MVRAILGLGSNLGERWNLLAEAVCSLRTTDPELVVSSIYETEPVGGPVGQGSFLNCVVLLHTSISPRELLRRCQGLEEAAHRVRQQRWGPRTLDADLLWIDGYESDDVELTVPHPRMFERAFVLAPLEELAPDLVRPEWRDELAMGGSAIAKVGALLAPSREGESR
jgi:2-amino-4-hydroxy-6-hydroxymethyldihydropteridine diphosphokinase